MESGKSTSLKQSCELQKTPSLLGGPASSHTVPSRHSYLTFVHNVPGLTVKLSYLLGEL